MRAGLLGILAALGAVLIGGPVWAADAPVAGQPFVLTKAAAPVIDGTLDDACWQKAPRQALRHYAGGELKVGGAVALCYDAEGLSVALWLDEPTPGLMVAPQVELNAAAFWTGEEIEWFICPSLDGNEYVQLAWNPAAGYGDPAFHTARHTATRPGGTTHATACAHRFQHPRRAGSASAASATQAGRHRPDHHPPREAGGHGPGALLSGEPHLSLLRRVPFPRHALRLQGIRRRDAAGAVCSPQDPPEIRVPISRLSVPCATSRCACTRPCRPPPPTTPALTSTPQASRSASAPRRPHSRRRRTSPSNPDPSSPPRRLPRASNSTNRPAAAGDGKLATLVATCWGNELAFAGALDRLPKPVQASIVTT